MTIGFRFCWLWLTVFAASLCLGCGDSGPEVGNVEGTITLDGEPLEGANVEFQPLFSDGSPSYSLDKTDANGYYKMGYQADREGVLIGKFQVQISTMDDIKQPDGSNKRLPERVPEKYRGIDSELEFEVVKGDNSADFDLTSK